MRTEPSIRRQAAGGSSGQPSAAQTPSFHGAPAAPPATPGCRARPGGPPATRRRRGGRRPARAVPADPRGDADSFDPGTRWSTSTPSRRCRARAEARGPRRQLVDAVQRLHHDALDAQVVAPHPLDELGVVEALDPDPAAPGDPGPCAVDGDRAGRGARRRRGCRRRPGGTSVTGLPSSRKPGPAGRVAVPCRSSSTTSGARGLFSTPTTAPQNPVCASSTTRPVSAGTSGGGVVRGCGQGGGTVRQHPPDASGRAPAGPSDSRGPWRRAAGPGRGWPGPSPGAAPR